MLGLQLAPVQQGIVGHLFLMVAARQLHVLGVQNHTQTVLGALLVQVEQVAQTQSLFAVLVAVGVGDAAAGGAEGTALLGKAVFFQPILHLVPRHRNGGLIGELQILGADFHTTGFDGLHLVCEVIEVNHHAGAQHTGHVRVQDAGGQQVQDELALLGDDGVSSIVAALIAGNDVSMFGQQVDDAALALIAPVDSSNSGKHNSLFPFFFVVYNGLHLGGQTIDADEAGGIALLVVAACLGTLLQAFQLTFLAHIAADGDDLAVVVMLFQSRNDDGRIQTAGICQHDLFDFRHGNCLRSKPTLILSNSLLQFPIAVAIIQAEKECVKSILHIAAM